MTCVTSYGSIRTTKIRTNKLPREIEKELALPEQCEGHPYLGDRDTFPFEERFYLQRLVDRALAGQLEQARGRMGQSANFNLALS